MATWMNAADAVLVTSDYEGFGMAAIEALACDVPVLSTPVGVAPYLLAGIPGCLCAPFDPDGLGRRRPSPPRRERPPRRRRRPRRDPRRGADGRARDRGLPSPDRPARLDWGLERGADVRMSDEHSSAAAAGDVGARIGEAERTLAAAAEAAAAAEQRAEAEIRALEADLERWRTESDRVRKELELRHEEELEKERSAKEQAIAAAEERLGEIEAQTDAAEERIAAAERRAEAAEEAVAAESARAREGAAAWLRERIDAGPPGGRGQIAAVAEYDVVVVGGGAAGLWTALRAAELGGRVCVVSRTPLSQSASFWAQGGLAAALEPGDSPERHAEDTLAAGRGLCRPAAVQVLVEEAPAAVRDLQARGVVFDLDHEGRLALGLEGGHSARRIVHSGGSQTGREITSKLAAMVAADERIEVRESTSATALW